MASGGGNMTDQEFWTVLEAAAIKGVTPQSIRNAVKRGAINARYDRYTIPVARRRLLIFNDALFVAYRPRRRKGGE